MLKLISGNKPKEVEVSYAGDADGGIRVYYDKIFAIHLEPAGGVFLMGLSDPQVEELTSKGVPIEVRSSVLQCLQLINIGGSRL